MGDATGREYLVVYVVKVSSHTNPGSQEKCVALDGNDPEIRCWECGSEIRPVSSAIIPEAGKRTILYVDERGGVRVFTEY